MPASNKPCKRFHKLPGYLVAGGLLLGLPSALLTSCSHGQKKIPELSQLHGKKVALVSIDGEPTARSVIEVALINQLMKRGTFELISKQDVEKARLAPEQGPTDWMGLAKRAGAEYALRAKVLEFDSEEKEGYSTEEVEDSQLAAEMGESARKSQHLYKVKSLKGTVRVQLDYVHVGSVTPDLRSGIADSTRTVTSEARTEAAHLPPRLRFLEDLSNEAFSKFFDQYE